MPQITVDPDVLRHALFGRSFSQVGDSLLQTKIAAPLKFSGFTFTPSSSLTARVLKKDERSAAVEYAFTAKADGKIAFAPASAGASSELELRETRVHGSSENAWDAVTDDLRSARTLLDLDDVRALRPGESLALQLDGALKAAVTFSWSDVLATKLPEILGERLPVAVKLKSGLDTTVSMKVTDRFSVVVSRDDDGRFRFAVKKGRVRNDTFGIEVSYGAELSAMPAIDEVLDAIFEKAPEQLEKARDAVRKRLAAAATWKAAAGFAYEYARIEENEAIAEFVLLDDTRLAGDYVLVLGGDFAKITDALRRDATSRELVKYLNERTITRRASFGFTLGLGKWTLKTADESVLRMATRTSLDGQFRLITCRGTRRYEEKNVPQNDVEWTVDLKAQMTEFLPKPTTLDFDYGLHLLVTLERGAFAEGDLARMLDLAAMWNVCVPDAGELRDAIGRKGSARVQLVFDRDVLAKALANEADLDSWAAPLAMAMPYSSTFPELRTFEGRRATYASAWSAWLRGKEARVNATGLLATVEQKKLPGSFAWAIEEGYGQSRRRLDSFLRGARALREAMTTAQAPERIAEAYGALKDFWSQRLYVLAVGRWLLDRAPEAQATLQFELSDTTITA